MDKTTILIFIIISLFIFSSTIWDIVWNISKTVFYLIIILLIINYFDPPAILKIKQMLNNFLNTDYNKIISNVVSNKDTLPQDYKIVPIPRPKDLVIRENKNLDATNVTGNRGLF